MSSARVSTACSASSPSARMVTLSPFLASPVIFRTLLALTSRSPFTITTCEENPLAAFTNRAAGRPWIPSSGPTVVSLCAMKSPLAPAHLCESRQIAPMILLLALESGYGAGRGGGHEPHVRRDGDELETLLCHARGVLGSAREDTRGETVLAGGGQHPVDSFDYRWLATVRTGSKPEALSQVRGPNEDGVETSDGEDLFQVIQGLLRLDHGHRRYGLVRVVGIVLAAVEGCPVRAIAAVSIGGVAAGVDEDFRFLAGGDHGADHRVAPGVEHAHDEAGIVPRHPNDGHGIRRRDGLEHRHEALIVHGPVLHVYGQAVPSRVRHHLGGEGAGYVQPPVHSGLSPAPDLSQSVLPHPRSPLSATRLPQIHFARTDPSRIPTGFTAGPSQC